VTGRIHAQRFVVDLGEEQLIISGPFRACRTCACRRQQIGATRIEGRILQVEMNFALDPLAQLPDCQGLCLAFFQDRGNFSGIQLSLLLWTRSSKA
jgi:hypothetical protein